MGIKAALPKYELYFYYVVLSMAMLWAASWIFEVSSCKSHTHSVSDQTKPSWTNFLAYHFLSVVHTSFSCHNRSAIVLHHSPSMVIYFSIQKDTWSCCIVWKARAMQGQVLWAMQAMQLRSCVSINTLGREGENRMGDTGLRSWTSMTKSQGKIPIVMWGIIVKNLKL